MLRFFIHIILLCCCCQFGTAQNIQQILATDGNASDGFGESVDMDTAANWAIIGAPRDSDLASTAGSAYIFNRNGNNWSEHAKITPNDIAALDNFGHVVAMSGNGNFAVVSALFDDDNGDDSGSAYVFVRLGNNWVEQAKFTALDAATMDAFGQSVAINDAGNVVVIGAYQDDNNGNNSGSAYIFTRNGTTWTEVTILTASDAAAEMQFGFDLSINGLGNRVVIGTFQATGSGKAYVFDENGGNWTETDILTPSDNPTDAWFGRSVSMSSDGNTIAIGANADNSIQGSVYIFENTGGWAESQKLLATDGAAGDNFGTDVAIHGSKVYIGANADDDNGNNSGAVYLFENGGLWTQLDKFVPTNITANDQFGDAIATNGDYLITGNKNDDDNGFLSGSAYIHDFSDLILVFGKLIGDTNDDCLDDAGDLNIPNGLIEFDNGTDKFYATTQAGGTYELPILPLGNYQVQPIVVSRYWEVCSPPLSFDNTPGTSSLNLNSIILSPIVDCPYMQVGISSPVLERCYESRYYVDYSNLGTDIAMNARIEIELDPFLSYINSSIPFSMIDGNVLTFDLGDVDIFEAGGFTIDALVDCTSTLGQNHCTEARIFPNAYCFPTWNGSRIEVEGECLGNQLQFRIRNIGVGNMLTTSKAQIIEDMIMRVNQDYQLDSGLEEIINFDANGGTVNLQTYQESGYPYPDTLLSITFEGCGAATPQMLGIFGEFPDNDLNPAVSIDCQPNVGAYDPNDKLAFPVGYEEQHLIQDDYELEYLIRFQNTGTDTAHQVILLDTLSPFLDPTSIQIETASHPYSFSILNDNILQFTFENIMLPDSSSNLEDSQGFVKFIVQQVPNNPVGTIIYNNASIYFDFNEPVVTNTVFHTIGADYVMIDLIDDVHDINLDDMKVSVGPNPFVNQLYISIQSVDNRNNTFNLYDTNGRLIHSQQNTSNSYILTLPVLPKGSYFYEITMNNVPIKTGKLIAH